MPRKVVTVEHVHEVTFRFVTPEPLSQVEKDRVAEAVRVYAAKTAGDVSIRELCFDEDGGEACLMTDGHRGLHEGATGRRWGSDL